MYLALLSGGRQLDRMLRGAMMLPAGKGAAIFDFNTFPSAPERDRFKRELRAAVDALGEGLTPDERVALLQEKRSIFWRNDSVIIAVFKDAKGPLLMAWLRLLRAVVLAYMRWTIVPSLLLLLFLTWRWYRSLMTVEM
jgi:heme oxygenase